MESYEKLWKEISLQKCLETKPSNSIFKNQCLQTHLFSLFLVIRHFVLHKIYLFFILIFNLFLLMVYFKLINIQGVIRKMVQNNNYYLVVRIHAKRHNFV